MTEYVISNSPVEPASGFKNADPPNHVFEPVGVLGITKIIQQCLLDYFLEIML